MTTIAHPELEGPERYKFGWADSDVAAESARRGLSGEVGGAGVLAGTGNLLARNTGVPTGRDEALAVVLGSPARTQLRPRGSR